MEHLSVVTTTDWFSFPVLGGQPELLIATNSNGPVPGIIRGDDCSLAMFHSLHNCVGRSQRDAHLAPCLARNDSCPLYRRCLAVQGGPLRMM